ncbi:hypothetical protein [Streptomyces sp. L2]|uniref:hypothetical protein n=1 Tax=Streptomyces sp. L2 TaxID=2162665 RepID=UPI001012D63D|nr:hypothetical protein [Streptomyces sp. L2]
MTGGAAARLRVPVGDDAQRWVTRAGCRRVLFVVHNVTSATRLLDVLPLFHADVRLQMFATCTGSSPFLAGVPELLAAAGLPVLPWEQAKETAFDLVVSASYGGELGSLQGKLAILSHGVGYNKKLAAPEPGARSPEPGARSPEPGARSPEPRSPEPGARSPEPGARSPGARSPGARSPEPGARSPEPVFGLSPDWLLEGGRPLATATVLSHPEQLQRLRAACPEAAPTAVLAGDPCFDRILAALPWRDRFRRALGVGPGQRLVVVSSTWAPRSLFGGAPGADDLLPWLLSRLSAELPVDEYRTTAVLHPNIWYGHGPGQVHAWLDNARRAGLDAIPPLDGWRQALIAADCVLGDHSSVTYYAAAIGVPVLLGAFPQGDLDPLSPVAALGRTAPRLVRRGSLRAQIERAVATYDPGHYKELADQTSSAPGRSAELLRRLFYGLVGIGEPDTHPALLDPLPLPPYTPARVTTPVRVLAGLTGPAEVTVVRYAAVGDEPGPDESPGVYADSPHTVVDEETRDTGRLRLADVVVRHADAQDPRLGPPGAWTAEALDRYPDCGLAAYADGPDRCVVRTREGRLLRLSAAPGPDGRPDLCDPAVYASALYAWTSGGRSVDQAVRDGITVRTGDTAHRVTVEALLA